MAGAANSSSERLPFTLQIFLKKRPEQFTCFLSIDIFDVIISFNVVFQKLPLIANCYCFQTVL